MVSHMRLIGKTQKHSCNPSPKEKMQVTHMIIVGLKTNCPKIKPKEYTTIYKAPTTTAVSNKCQHRFKEKASTKQSIPLKTNKFCLSKIYNPDKMKIVEQGKW